MKQFMKRSLFLLLCSAAFSPHMQAVTDPIADASGAAATNKTLITPANSSAYDKANKVLFYALKADASTNNPSEDALGFVKTTDATITYSGIAREGASASNSTVRNSNITSVAVVNNGASNTTRTNPEETRILFVSNKANTAALPVGVFCTTITGGTPTFRSLTDGNDTPAACINTFSVVAGNSGTQMCGFTTVKGNAAGANKDREHFGEHADDAIVSLAIGTDNGIDQETTYPSSPVLTTSLAYGAAGVVARGPAAMCYDETLKRLYVGQNYITAAANGNGTAGGLCVRIFDVNASGQLSSLYSCGVNSSGAYDGGIAVVNGKNIIGGRGVSQPLSVNNLGVMHTTRGPSAGTKFAYLIVNGGNFTRPASKKWVFSVPLVVGDSTAVSTAEATDTTNIGVINGTFANVKTADYSERADAAGELFTTSTAAALVGRGPLPIDVLETSTTHMRVVGDAVLVAIETDSTSTKLTKTSGVWHSRCRFNKHGQIDHWTEWRKFGPNHLGDGFNDGHVALLEFDPTTGKTWVLDSARTTLRSTSWENSSYDAAAAGRAADVKGLLTNLNLSRNMGGGCTAVCDLNSTTTAWGDTTPQRIALFGSVNGNVCFAKTGSGVHGSTQLGLSNPGDIITSNTAIHHQFASADMDYRFAETLITTTVAAGKAIKHLEYSKWNSCTAASQTNGYFFAGTDEDGGVYVWAHATAPGVGFNTRDDIGNLNSDPFRESGGSNPNGSAPRKWWKLDTKTDGTTRRNLLSGYPRKIRSEGGCVYILTRGENVKTDKIYRLSRKNNKMALAQDLCVTASAGSTGSGTNSDLRNVNFIYDFAITVTTTGDTSTQAATGGLALGEQLAMLTDDGIYTTTCSVGTDNWAVGKGHDNAQLHCGWEKMDVPDTANTWQAIMLENESDRDPSHFSFLRAEANANDASVFDKLSLYTLNRRPLAESRGGNGYGVSGLNDADTGTTNWELSTVNAFDGTSTEPTAFDQLPRLSSFYDDGALRLFGFVEGGEDQLGLFAIPHRTDAAGHNVTSPTSQHAPGSALERGHHVHWIKRIGDTGMLLFGNTGGVGALG